MSGVLGSILAERRRLDAEFGVPDLPPAAESGRRSLARAVANAGAWPPVIAEIKRESPSRGTINRDADPVAIARAYETAGACAISLLTDPIRFGGAADLIAPVREAVSLPVLAKDFVVTRARLRVLAAAGADAILLIAEAFDDPREMAALREEARSLGLSVVAEVHRPENLSRVLDLDPDLLGINRRDLETLAVDPDRARAIAARIPEAFRDTHHVFVFSGIRDAGDLTRELRGGFDRPAGREGTLDGALVGTALMERGTPDEIGRALANLIAGSVGGHVEAPEVKICGLRTAEAQDAAVDAGASYVGFVFHPASPRHLAREAARALRDRLPGSVRAVGVFANAPRDEVDRTIAAVGLDIVQFSGNEPPEAATDLAVPFWRSLTEADALEPEATLGRMRAFPRPPALLLFEKKSGGAFGGTGEPLALRSIVPGVRRIAYESGLPFGLAGGLDPENVATAIRLARPHVVDVSSGVESERGVKSRGRIRAFCTAVATGGGRS